MIKKLVMEFYTTQGGTTTLSVDSPKAELTEAEVRAVMESIIVANMFYTGKGDIASIKGAQVITTSEDVLI